MIDFELLRTHGITLARPTEDSLADGAIDRTLSRDEDADELSDFDYHGQHERFTS